VAFEGMWSRGGMSRRRVDGTDKGATRVSTTEPLEVGMVVRMWAPLGPTPRRRPAPGLDDTDTDTNTADHLEKKVQDGYYDDIDIDMILIYYIYIYMDMADGWGGQVNRGKHKRAGVGTWPFPPPRLPSHEP